MTALMMILTMSVTEGCIACPPSSAGPMCRISCPSDLDQEGPGTGRCIRCPTASAIPTGVAVVDVTLPTDPATALTTLQLGINSPGGTHCPCNIAKGCKAPLNATTDLLRLQPQFVRTHDVYLLNPSTFSVSPPNPLGTHTLNWADLFPSLAADPSLPASYNFTSADAWPNAFVPRRQIQRALCTATDAWTDGSENLPNPASRTWCRRPFRSRCALGPPRSSQSQQPQ